MTKEKYEKPTAKQGARSGGLGDHPASTGLGAVAGGLATGAVVGTVAGPLGTIAGATVGAIAGGVAGAALGEAIDPVVEEAHWKKTYSQEKYYQTGLTYDDYGPAYRVGFQGRGKHRGRKFDDVQSNLEADYNRVKGSSRLSWDKAKRATRAAWDRIERAMPGDLDRDGK
jgi:hypothetical protein